MSVSEEARQSAAERLEDMGEGGDTDAATGKEKDPKNVARGLKAYVFLHLPHH
jgi:hypothetical protein